MSSLKELNSYIARLQQRLRLGVTVRGAAIFIGTALAVTVLLALVLNHYAFPAHGLTGARLVLVVALLTAAALGLAAPLLRQTRSRAVRHAEIAHPDLEQRLTTFHEAERKGANPFLELLAADTLRHTSYAEPETLVSNNRVFAFAGAGVACLAVLVWMIAAAPGYVGYGASLLWTGPKKNASPLYAIIVAPGDIAVRRNSDQLITARVKGMHPEKVQLFAHYQSTGGWEPVAMQAAPDASGAAYQFVFAGLPENVEYYVAAGPLVSPHYKVRVVDLPTVKDVRVTYQYPRWTGLKPVTEEHSGDLRAIEGTEAQIEVEMDHPLRDGQLMLEGGQVIHLAAWNDGAPNRYRGTIPMQKDGAYHVAATDDGQPVRLSEDYFIATDKAMPPEVAVSRPGGDYRASPIEEVTVGVKAADQFGLADVHLHYSVNAGPDHVVDVLKTPGAKSADGSQTLALEDYKLVPGDLISVYATARDGHAEARTDISFIQVEPFEREFSQSQQSGGGGGGQGNQNNQTEISRRQKELIAATWKQQNDKTATPKDAAAAGQFLADAQQRLRDQVMALSARMQSRDLSEANEEFNGFNKDMQMAAAAMAPSAGKLQGMQWKDAVPLEQKALQALLRAEATFRQIQVAFGQQGAGGGGGNSAGRDLASLFDLELDTEKNQYETAQTASPAEQHEKAVEDALAKLDALAKRQEELASQQHNPQQSFQDRWQQEMLRRQAEELKRQMEQLAQNGQQGQQNSAPGQSGPGQKSGSQQSANGQNGSQASQQQRSNNFSGQQSPESGQPGSMGDSAGRQSNSQSGPHDDQRVEQALSRLQQAGDDMKRGGGQQQSVEAARRAAEQLRQAENLLAGTQHQLATGKLDSLAGEADRLTQLERAQADRIDKLANAAAQAAALQPSDPNAPETMDRESMMQRLRERNQLAQERQQLSNDLSRLQKDVRDTARAMAPNQPGVAQKLRDALTEMDDSDLDNHVQRTADWLRRGVNPNSNGTENEIAQGLSRLDQQLQAAQKGMGQAPKQGNGKPGDRGSQPGDETAALDQVQRLRSQIEAMARSGVSASSGDAGRQNGRGSQQAQNGNAAQPGRQQSANGRTSSGAGQPSGQGTNPAPSGNEQGGGNQGQPSRQQAGGNGDGSYRAGEAGRTANGEVRSAGPRHGEGTVWGNTNTGNNRYGQPGNQSAGSDGSANATDAEQTYRQSMRALSQLRQSIQNDPQAAKEVADLARQMQRLDPARFPGNPALVEQMHNEVLSAVDRLELQLERDGNDTEARTGMSSTSPTGYQDSVADYYRQLSKNP